MLRAGQDVQCIKVDDGAKSAGFIVPNEGEIYRIRDIGPCSLAGFIIITVEEIEPQFWLGREVGFKADYFRPLTRRNIEIVEALKAPPPEQVEPLSPLEVAFQ